MDEGAKTLQQMLAELIEKGMVASMPRPRPTLRMRPGPTPKATANAIAENLVRQAVASGLPLRNIKVEQRTLGGGNTAESVSELTLYAPFVFKLDSRKSKLAAEGHMMQAARLHPRLSERSRSAWPVVYAIRDEPPYAYLMEYFPREDGWISLEDRLYPGVGAQAISSAEAGRLIHAVLDVLVETYSDSADSRAHPSLEEDYLGRIANRLKAVAQDRRFSSRPLRINGEDIEPWQYYLDRLWSSMDFIAKITPKFNTIAHGDPNPGNLMLRTGTGGVDVKLIDPKEWQTGDYLFDIAKITHFIEATGPIEKPISGSPTTVEYIDGDDTAELKYTVDSPAWTGLLVDACLDRVRQFASAKGDEHWHARYELAMAANLLGLPEGRLESRPHAALALYGEGLRWLKRFCERLPQSDTGPVPERTAASLSDIEPDPLALARERVRSDAPGVTEALDRRGFQMLQWAPRRSNRSDKPMELSLEHEARMSTSSSKGLSALQKALAASCEMQSGNALLPGEAHFQSWRVRRVPRASGAQSIDRYWDLKGADVDRRLIPRMITLRERVKSSDFMTWDSHGEEHSLNLELPFVAYAQSSVVARLEFNWIDRIASAMEDFNAAEREGETDQPMVLASRIVGIDKGEFEPVLEHTTFREKYSLGQNEGDTFQLNVDHVVAQSLRTKRIATFTDVDIAPSRIVQPDVLVELIAFAQALGQRFDLGPVNATKAHCGAKMTGEM